MPGDPLLARPSAESVLPTRGRRGDSASKCVSPSPQRRADSAIGRAGWGTAPADLAVLARAEAFAHRTSAARTSLPPLAKRVAGRGRLGRSPSGVGGASPRRFVDVRRGCRWQPWPNHRVILVALAPRPAIPPPLPLPATRLRRAGGGRSEK